ncbi:MAG: 3-oxoacyl-[acyl-carrier-protein] reductase [Candidatus Eisenbacteria bacterium]|uniref:3-oxoacyl-[acyl-carrier-protein] reductase n=1 Tax=Eiseniibacteriota bacterium TaxID=2212470 RepID=A0A948WC50_UNCEI|nr:3-oxoacyl-[acyl-carrier-protein] reductase [Candidatus Eisenbacteria bacterium]MBU1948921.1 3-oxoacyl-[acyl-carrier-protein] reductase [Candidatus Eisenbacteria bacterium]MBU2690593.1 3-oxoacyl-[acyl-carrier-protein] reductase [Candidatus Eisenbacteria bacterium]
MTASLEGRVAVVTGGSRGIGRAISLELAHLGADVVLMDRTGDPEGQTVKDIRALGRKCRHIACDVSRGASVEEAAAKARESLGPVQILVNNAGITRDQLAVRLSEEDWDKVLDINLKGAFLCCKAFARDMMKARWGRIINISSVVGQRGNVGQVNYAAAKAGMIGLSRSLARELAGRGITVNVVAPGFIETAMTDAIGEKAREALLPLIPISRLGKCEDVGSAVGFFASDQAGYITGQVLNVDGGMVMS